MTKPSIGAIAVALLDVVWAKNELECLAGYPFGKPSPYDLACRICSLYSKFKRDGLYTDILIELHVQGETEIADEFRQVVANANA